MAAESTVKCKEKRKEKDKIQVNGRTYTWAAFQKDTTKWRIRNMRKTFRKIINKPGVEHDYLKKRETFLYIWADTDW